MSSSTDSKLFKYLALGATTAASLAAYYYYFFNNSKIPSNITTTQATISQLYVFPVKSCSGVSVNSVELLETGAKFDREWAIVSVETGKVVTQREYPILRCITAFIDDASGSLVLNYANRRFVSSSTAAAAASTSSSSDFSNIPTPQNPSSNAASASVLSDMNSPASPPPSPLSASSLAPTDPKSFTLSIHKSNQAIEAYRANGGDSEQPHILPVILWGIAGQLFDEGDDVAEFFSSIIGIKVRLGRIFAHRRPAQSGSHKGITQDEDIVSMQDFSTLHIITEEGVKHIADQADSVPNASKVDRVDALRFRPNIVVSGVPFPEEDYWKTLTIKSSGQQQHEDVKIRVAKHCGRCSIPTILTDSSRDKAYFPTGQLKKSRNAFYTHQVDREFDGKQKWPMFGLNVFHEMPQQQNSSNNNEGGEKSSSVVSSVKIYVGDNVEINTFATKKEDVLVFE